MVNKTYWYEFNTANPHAAIPVYLLQCGCAIISPYIKRINYKATNKQTAGNPYMIVVTMDALQTCTSSHTNTVPLTNIRILDKRIY
jgi:hypothetical protein